jgi:hypothetical protein
MWFEWFHSLAGLFEGVRSLALLLSSRDGIWRDDRESNNVLVFEEKASSGTYRFMGLRLRAAAAHSDASLFSFMHAFRELRFGPNDLRI